MHKTTEEHKELTVKDFYFCYSPPLFKFLKLRKGLNYICMGLNENTHQKFWTFQRSNKLYEALKEFTEHNNFKMS